MDRLWAPWRAQYIQSSADRSEPVVGGQPCFLCRGIESDPACDRDNFLVWRGSRSAIFLNRFPYNSGHLLVCPLVHRSRLSDLTGPDLIEPIETIQKLEEILDQMFHPEGYNVGLNLGKSAGAGLPGHLHWHIVPRWDGDSNFMPVLGETKVMVESLFQLYDRLVAKLSSGI